jgi:phosphatidylglycerol:prolipoprotein diacylglycerol transferase
MAPRIYHDIDPFIIRITDTFGIRWYSLAYILGFLLVRWYLIRAARAGEVPNLTPERVDSYVQWAFLGALVGARFFHVFVFEFRHYGFDPFAWIAVWRGGLAFHGGFTGVAIATFWFCRRHRISFYGIADRAVIPIAIALAYGRIANFINGEMYGRVWEGPFCIDYSQSRFLARPPEGCRYPVQFYQLAKNLGIATALWFTLRRWRPPEGAIFWSFVGLYGFIRFWLMYLRDEEIIWMGLTQSQMFSGLMAVVGAIMVSGLLLRAPQRARR